MLHAVIVSVGEESVDGRGGWKRWGAEGGWGLVGGGGGGWVLLSGGGCRVKAVVNWESWLLKGAVRDGVGGGGDVGGGRGGGRVSGGGGKVEIGGEEGGIGEGSGGAAVGMERVVEREVLGGWGGVGGRGWG